MELLHRAREGAEAERLIHELFEARAAAAPEAVALAAPGVRLTYRELDARASRLAGVLAERGVAAEAVVALCLPRGVDLVVTLLAVLKAGGAYLPLDRTHPPVRLAYMLEAAAADLVVATEESADLAAERLDLHSLDLDALPILARARSLHPDNLAYVVFTSGSTGEPKPVAVTHRSLVNHARAVQERFGLTAEDRVLQFANPAFDVFAEELFPTLAAGASLVVGPADGAPQTLERYLDAEGVTVANVPASYWAQWTRDLESAPRSLPPRLRLLVVGSEASDVPTLTRWRRHTDVPVVNAFGLSETTITVAAQTFADEAPPGTDTLPVGAALPGASLHVLDHDLERASDGRPGELYVGGEALARGYHGRPGLTAERFVPDSIGPRPGGRLYRTGDLGRVLPDGTVEFLGRVDGQVKIRGHRIEPHEVEAALVSHRDLARAHVGAHRDPRRHETVLAAYVVPRDDRRVPPASELRAHLRERLPEYMVPSAFVVLDALPLAPNGKVDPRALPEPVTRTVEAGYEPPRTEAEQLVARIWKQILFVDRVGIHDDFFELGGHSLSAAQIAARLQSALGVSLSVAEVFSHATPARLARHVEDGGAERERPSLPPIRHRPEERRAPLSYQQEQVWFLGKLAPESIAYHAQTTIRVVGPLDLEILGRAATELARRHEVLRTTYEEVDGVPWQVIHPPEPVEIVEVDLAGTEDNAVEELVERELRRPFDLSRLPLVRWTAIRLGSDEHELVLVEHHLVHDGWSFALLVRELKALYAAFSRGEPSLLPAPAVQYRDFARWQREALETEAMQAQLRYWRERLRGLPPPLAVPTTRPRPKTQTFRGETIRSELPPSLPRALRAFGRRERVTLFTTMYAAFAALLHRCTQETDLCIGSAFANRQLPETEHLLGMLVNAVLLRCEVSGDRSFRELVVEARDVVLEASRNQELPFPALVRALNPGRDPARNPLTQVLFSANDSPLPELRLGDAAGTIFERGNGSAKVDLDVVVIPRAESQMDDAEQLDDRITLLWEYNADLFDPAGMRQLLDTYVRLLEAAVSHPEARIADLPIMSEEERRQALVVWSGQAGREATEPLVPAAIAEQARRTPDAVALVSGERRLTYGELLRDADGVAGRLRGLGVGPESVVAVSLPRGVDLVVGAFGVLRAGAAYLPLDPHGPPDRAAYACADAGVALVLGAAELEAALVGAPEQPQLPAPDGRNLAYVVYTSGSTGRPKGVMVEHRSLANLAWWRIRSCGIGPGERTTLVANPEFDASVIDIWPALAAGATLYIADDETRVSPQRLQAWLLERGITITDVPTPLAEQLLALPWPPSSPLRLLVTGGDRLRLRPDPALPFRVVNDYGPTEATVSATSGAVAPSSDGDSRPDIGRPVAGVTAYVLDPELRPVPVGVAGELYLGGAGLARGYQNRAAATADRFVPDPFSARPGGRLYRTGDLARHLPDGRLDFLGRVDAQFKLRGHRIEPAEVVAALHRSLALDAAHVALRTDAKTGEPRLVAYLVPRDGRPVPEPPRLRELLARDLPPSMIPSATIVLPALPITRNGKVDEEALPELETAAPPAAEPPATELERTLAAFWQDALRLPAVGVEDNFFDLGGHSLLLGQVHHRLTTHLGRAVPLLTLFEHPTIRSLARHLEGADGAALADRAAERRSGSLRLRQRRAQREAAR